MTRTIFFLLGCLATMSVLGAAFFLRFWRETREPVFLAFSIFFLAEAATRVGAIFMDHPNEGAPWVYILRIGTSLLIVAAILRINYRRDRD